MGVCVSKKAATLETTYSRSPADDANYSRRPSPAAEITPSPVSFVSIAAQSTKNLDRAEIKCRTFATKLSCVAIASKVTHLVSEWKRTGVLCAIQSHVLAVSATLNSSLEELSLVLTQFKQLELFHEQLEIQTAKAYAIFYWITINIKYDKSAWIDSVRGIKVPSLSPSNVVAMQRTVSEGYSTLFHAMATIASLNAVLIRGHERAGRIPGKGSIPNRFIPDDENAHTWNAVEINNSWVLLDCSYGPRSVAHGWQTTDCLSPHYFAVPPEQLIFTHWPQDQRWQLIEKPVTLSDIEAFVAPHAGVYALGINAVTCFEKIELTAHLPGPIIHLELKAPPSVVLNAHLVSLDTPGSPESPTPCGGDRTTYIHREGEEQHSVHIYVLCPAEGQYCINIYAQPVVTDPPMFCFLYYVVNHVPANEFYNCPFISHLAAAAFKFELLSWNTTQMPFVAKNESGKMDVKFKAAPNVKLHHYIAPVTGDSAKQQACHYYTHVTRQRANPEFCFMQVLFPNEGWWDVFIFCSTNAAPDGSTSGYTLVANIRMYACKGINGQTFPRITSPAVIFESSKPILAPDGDVLQVPFQYTNSDALEAYIKESNSAQPMADYAIVEDLNQGQYLLHCVLPQTGKWEISVVAKMSFEDSPKTVMVFQLFAEVKQGMKNTIFPYLFPAPTKDLGIKMVNSRPITYDGDGSNFSLAFRAPEGLEFQHGIELMLNPDSLPKSSQSSLLDYCTYLHYPSRPCELHTLQALFPATGVWSVNLYARRGSSGVFYQVITINNVEISTTGQVQKCYPRLNPSYHGIAIPSDFLPCPHVIEQSEFKFPFFAPGALYFICSMNMEGSEECTFDHVFVHKTETDKYIMHAVFPKLGKWIIHIKAKLQSTDEQESMLLFQLKLKAVGSSPDMAFPQIFEPFYTKFSMKTSENQFPLLCRVKKVPSTLVIPFYSPGDVLLWHLAQINEVVNEAATQIPPSSEPGKHDLVIEFSRSGKWIITLYAQHASAVEKTDWTPVLRHVVTVGRSTSVQSST